MINTYSGFDKKQQKFTVDKVLIKNMICYSVVYSGYT